MTPLSELDFTLFPVLVVDDEQDNLDAFRFVFRKSFRLTYAQGGEQALALIDTLDPAVIVTDQRMPGLSGIDVLKLATQKRPDAVGVLLTAYTDLPVLLEAINSGAVYRYVQKPWDSKELAVVLRQSIERFHTLRENRRLRERLARYAGYLEAEQRNPMDFGELAAESAPMKKAVSQIEQLSGETSPVLIAGEPGTEKELLARALHVSSSRESKPFVVVSCPSFAGDALERELFGWQKGAFEGALGDRLGKVELAHEGTLVLSEIGELSPSLVLALEKMLAGAGVRRVGAREDVKGDVRLVMTTSRTAPSAEHSGFASRIGASRVDVPPLRARLEDLPEMCVRLLVRAALHHGRPARNFAPEAIAKLMTYAWPGNLAELTSVVERAVLVCEGEAIGVSHLAFFDSIGAPLADAASGAAGPTGLPAQLDDLERRELCSALERCGGNKAEVARLLGIQRTTLYYRLKRLGIEAS